jgi:ABC-type multidrug transport system ATPase subunit/ABC-type multidrug transport system permease subunit
VTETKQFFQKGDAVNMTGNSGYKTVLSTPYFELHKSGQLLRFPLKLDWHKLGRDRARVDLIVPDDWVLISGCHAVLRRVGDNYQIYDGDGQRSSTNGLFINQQRITVNNGYLLYDGIELKIGQDPQNQILLKYYNPVTPTNPPTPCLPGGISLYNRSVLLGRDPQSSLVLNSPIVSRHHATIEPDGKGNYLVTDYSTNGVFINGKTINHSALLFNNASLRIGPFVLVRRGDQLEVFNPGNQIRLDAENLVIPHRLNEISLAIEPGQFVALVGGSGAGKSTLMKALLGIEKIQKGGVYLNGDDLRKNFNIYRTQIGYVPQDDIIHADLTVEEVLLYAAKLRLPPDINLPEIVKKTIDDIGMSHKRTSPVRELSGGQRKRVSIGVELIADPKLFFLDEPTSGLDPGRDLMMMELMRKLANEGRTVVLVTHATANISLCDRVVFLGRGGNQCYFGPPAQAFDFFGEKDNFAKIYIKLEPEVEKYHNETEEIAQKEAKRFRQSSYHQQYIGNYLIRSVSQNSQNQNPQGIPQQVKPSFGRQLIILAQRYGQLILRDKTNLLLSLLTAPIGISLIPLALKEAPLIPADPLDPKTAPLALRVLFVFTSAALWVGLSSSVQEIVKESAIYLRERLVNLSLLTYLGSKLLILGGLAFFQAWFITIAVLFWFDDPTFNLIWWPLGFGITTFLTLLTSICFGLMVSAFAKNSSQANSALPLILLPQIIFSGVLFKMEGIASKVSWLMLSRWSIGAYGALVNVNAMVPEAQILPDGSKVSLPFEPTAVYEPNWENLALNWGALGIHIFVYLGITLLLQKRKDIV